MPAIPGSAGTAGPTQHRSRAISTQHFVVEVSDTQGHLRVDPEALAGIARRALEAEGIGRAEVSIGLVDDATLHVLNRRHLGHDWPTDVISFGLSEPGAAGLAGEVVISAERAAAEARRRGADPLAELALYLVHGLLHLCGHDDQTAEAAEAMRRREAEVLADVGFSNPFPLADPAEVGRETLRWPV